MSGRAKVIFLSFFTIVALVGSGSFITIHAAQVQRGFSLFPKYTNVVIGKGEEVNLDLKVINTGKKEEEVLLSIIPEKKARNWKVSIETEWDKIGVRSVYLFPQKPDNSANLKFHAIPPAKAPGGEYRFVIKGTTRDGKIQHSVGIKIFLKKEKEISKAISQKISLTSKYPSIENPAGKDFKFEVEVKNNTDKALVLNFGVKPPYGWRVYCSPRWEEEKKISAIKIHAKGSENLLITATPPINVSKGKYPIVFVVKSEKEEKTLELKAIVTGTYKLVMKTETGRLNTDTVAGKEKHLTVYLWNEGSAPVENISFFSDKPNKWEVTFKPDKISSILPFQQVGKPEKVDVVIKAPLRTLPGDYMVTLTAAGKQDQKQIDLRVTVKTSTTWGWVGVGIVAIVIVSLILIFVRLGRR